MMNVSEDPEPRQNAVSMQEEMQSSRPEADTGDVPKVEIIPLDGNAASGNGHAASNWMVDDSKLSFQEIHGGTEDMLKHIEDIQRFKVVPADLWDTANHLRFLHFKGFPEIDSDKLSAEDPLEIELDLTPPSANPFTTDYITISYVWQRPSPVEISSNMGLPRYRIKDLERPSLQPRSPHCPVDVLHRACRFAQTKGLSLIWIDQECIRQDDAEDVNLHLQCIKKIYARSRYTIAPLCQMVSDVEEAKLFRVLCKGDPSEDVLKSLSSVDFSDSCAGILKRISEDIWFTRAWTYQERLCTSNLYLLINRHPSLATYPGLGEDPSEIQLSLNKLREYIIRPRLQSRKSLTFSPQKGEVADATQIIRSWSFAAFGNPGGFMVTLKQLGDDRGDAFGHQISDIFNTLEACHITHESDRLAILADLCGLPNRLNSTLLDNSKYSFSTCMLVLLLNNGLLPKFPSMEGNSDICPVPLHMTIRGVMSNILVDMNPDLPAKRWHSVLVSNTPGLSKMVWLSSKVPKSDLKWPPFDSDGLKAYSQKLPVAFLLPQGEWPPEAGQVENTESSTNPEFSETGISHPKPPASKDSDQNGEARPINPRIGDFSSKNSQCSNVEEYDDKHTSEATTTRVTGVQRKADTVNQNRQEDSNMLITSTTRMREANAMQSVIKYQEKRYNEKGESYIAEMPHGAVEDKEKEDEGDQFALCVTRELSSDNSYVRNTTLQINSEPLKSLLRRVITYYPGISLQTQKVILNFPTRCLFHYRKELQETGSKMFEGDSLGSAHLRLLLDFIGTRFNDTIEEEENLHKEGLSTYEHIWALFRPNTIVYVSKFGRPHAYKLSSSRYTKSPQPAFKMRGYYTDYDGEAFGNVSKDLSIGEFAGVESITNLGVHPLKFDKEPSVLSRALISRGRRFESLGGMHTRYYDDIGFDLNGDRYHIKGRVIIDCKTFHRLNANKAFTVSAFEDSRDKKEKAEKPLVPLSDEQCMLADSLVRGFSLTEKKWLDIFVDKIEEIDWNTRCFDQLVLPDVQKDIVRALVCSHVRERSLVFDDIVKGKGKGLTFVLHGPPGVGKTLTAECVAEYTRSPLYMVSSGELGIESGQLDTRLSRILDIASTWKAVLLIDEADVFLEKRSTHDLQRNSLVSIFLRVLEYYEGIMFLTSNRVDTFDDAFKSRIHVPLKYYDLTPKSREQLWRNFVRTIPEVDMIEQDFEALSQHELNGRQIKNVIKTAQSLAAYREVKLNREQLEQVIEIQVEFEKDFC